MSKPTISSRHAGPTHPEEHRSRANARLGHRASASAGFERRASMVNQARLLPALHRLEQQG